MYLHKYGVRTGIVPIASTSDKILLLVVESAVIIMEPTQDQDGGVCSVNDHLELQKHDWLGY